MKKWKIAAAALCVCALLTAAYAANAGSANDPLITLSYLNTTFSRQVQTMVDQTVSQRKAEMEQALRNILAGQGGTSAPSGSGSVFTVVTLNQGQSLVGDVGCEVMLRVGAAVCVAPSAPGLVDETTAGILNNGGALVQNHLYMMTIEGRGVRATAAAKVLARGSYTVT